MIFNKKFMRLFSLYRMMEADAERWGEVSGELALEVRELKQKAESDAALIDSLNRYIAALEGRAAYQADLLKDLKRRLKEIIAKPKKAR